MLMSVFNLLINHLLGNNSANQPAPGLIANLTLTSVRKILMIMAGLAASLTLFVGGFLTVLMDLVLSSRDNQQLMLSPASIVGFALIGISALVAMTLFSRKVWKLAPSVRAEAPAASPVQQAMAELIHDFVEERRLGREMAMEQMAAQAAMAQAEATAVTAMSDMPVPDGSQAQGLPVYN